MKLKLLRQINKMSKLCLYGVFLQALFCSIILAKDSHAQKKSVEDIVLSLEIKNSSLNDAFIEISRQTNLYFAFDKRFVNEKQKINLNVENESLGDILRQMSKDLKIKFKRIDETIHVSPNIYKQRKSTKLVEEYIFQHKVSGIVRSSEDGEPLPGVSILVQGTQNGTTTDFEGKFQLEIPNESVLLFSFIGFETQEFTVTNQSTIDISLNPDTEQLEEVIVVGYGTVRKSDLTGSVGSLSGEDLNSQPVTSVDQGLQGRIAGVNVTNNSSAPGGGVSIKIRGTTSILNGSEPLYVIDGFPVTGQSQFNTNAGRGLDSSTGTDYTVDQNPLATLNPADIESIEVLKDASATAIYGVRGANGVILITTKRGKKGAPKVSFNGYYGVQSSAKQIELMNAQEYQNIYNESAANSGDPVVFPDNPPNDMNWQDMIMRKAAIQNYQLSVSGGSEAVQYMVSGSYFDQEGILTGSDFTRYSMRVNLDIKASEKFKIGNSLNVSRSINNASETEGEATNSMTHTALAMSPILPVYLPDGTYSSNRFLPANVPDAQGSLNPIAFINEFSDEQVVTRVLTTLYGEYQIIPDLKLKVSLGADLENRDRHVFRSSKFNNENPLNSANASGLNRNSWLNENILTYDKNFNKHHITALGGFTSQREQEEYRAISARGFASDITGPYDLGGGSVVPSVDSRFAEFSILSFIGRVNYNYDDRFLATFTARRDGSSKFADGNQWATFPSVAAAWRISNEDFMSESASFMDNLKLRIGWGKAGNQELPTYRSLALLQATPYNFGNGTIVNGYSPFRVAVPDLTWEITTMSNYGLDASFFGNRLNLTFDYYIKETEDLLLEVQLPETSGIRNPSVQNLGQMENRGWELTIDGVLLDKNDFKWDFGFNFAKNKNEITSLGSSSKVGEGDQSYEIAQPTFAGATPRSFVTIGEPLGVFIGYTTDGLYRSQAEADAGQTLQPGVVPGMIRYKDINNDGILDVNDRSVIGSPHPDFLYGFNSSLSYKDFQLRFFFQGQSGGVVYNAMRRFNTTVTRGQNVLKERGDYWTPQNTDAPWPTPFQNAPQVGGTGSMGESDWFLEDASYLRMREITLTYSFPQSFLGKMDGSIYVTGQNLFTITDYTGYNPDTNGRANVRGSFGWDISSYPMAKTYLVGLKLNF